MGLLAAGGGAWQLSSEQESRCTAPVFDTDWARQNLAVVYRHHLQDGLGSQAIRMLGVYAIAASLGLPSYHVPLGCVGPNGGKVGYGAPEACNYTSGADERMHQLVNNMLQLPSSITEEAVRGWERVELDGVSWDELVSAATDAYEHKTPTVLLIGAPNAIRDCPKMLLSVPYFQPNAPETRLVCPDPSQPELLAPGKPWLLKALRVAFHFRLADTSQAGTTGRKRSSADTMPADYFVNVYRQIREVLDAAGCEFFVELYTELPVSAGGQRDLSWMMQQMPNALLHGSTNVLWTMQMMATADVLVMSNTALSTTAALLNPNAFIVYPDVHGSAASPDNAKDLTDILQMRHWHVPLDADGTLAAESLEELRQRLGAPPAVA